MKFNLPTINVQARYNLRDHVNGIPDHAQYIAVNRDGSIIAGEHMPNYSPLSLVWEFDGDGYDIGQLPNALPIEDWATHCYAIKPVEPVTVREITDCLRALALAEDEHPESLVIAAEDILQRIEDAGVTT